MNIYVDYIIFLRSQMNCKPGSVIQIYHLSRLKITFKLKQLTLMTSQELLLVFSTLSSLLSLAPSGVFQRSLLPIEPVCSYHAFSPLPCYGGLFSVALSLGSPLPGITWHCILVESGLSSLKN